MKALGALLSLLLALPAAAEDPPPDAPGAPAPLEAPAPDPGGVDRERMALLELIVDAAVRVSRVAEDYPSYLTSLSAVCYHERGTFWRRTLRERPATAQERQCLAQRDRIGEAWTAFEAAGQSFVGEEGDSLDWAWLDTNQRDVRAKMRAFTTTLDQATTWMRDNGFTTRGADGSTSCLQPDDSFLGGDIPCSWCQVNRGEEEGGGEEGGE